MKKSYSVPEIRQMLGIGKTSAYTLVKTGFFQTVTVGGSIRVMKNSFDEWFANQTHYSLSDKYMGGNDGGINH